MLEVLTARACFDCITFTLSETPYLNITVKIKKLCKVTYIRNCKLSGRGVYMAEIRAADR